MVGKNGLLALVVFNAIYIIFFVGRYIYQLNYEFLLYSAVVIIVALVILLTLKKTDFDYLALWGLSVWGLIHMMGGGAVVINGTRLYSIRLIELVNLGGDFFILKFDQLVHFYGFAITAIVIYQLLAPRMKDLRSKVPVFMAWIGGMGLGALNEVVEFTAFVSFEKTGVGDLSNFGLDLVFNLFGALAGAFVAYYWHKHKLKKLKRH